jgi:site-specific recombinase XerD
MPKIQSDTAKEEFIKYLSSLGISPKTHKNYRSDLAHFLSWAILKVRSFGSYVESLSEVIPFLNSDLSREYKNYMIENRMPVKTVNRRLSTLRHLSRFLVNSHTIDTDFTDGLENAGINLKKRSEMDPVINNFKSYLEAEKVSPNTIKNYLSDIKHFMTWLEVNK